MLGEAIPLYPLYALLFADTGLNDAEISALLAIWSAVGIAAEVPTGVLADRFSRRANLVGSSLLTGAGFAAWALAPSFAGFAVGFVLWGLGGALQSGAEEALLFDGLADAGAHHHYARVRGALTSAALVVQAPSALVATLLFTLGGYPLVGWVSVGVALVAAGLAARLPEPPRTGADPEDDDEDGAPELGYLATLRAGVIEAARRPSVRAAAFGAALLGGFDAIEEYFGLLAQDWGITVAVVPPALLMISLAGAAGAACGGAAARARPWVLGVALGAAMLLFGAAGLVALPVGVVAMALFYGIYRAVLVVADARLQEHITGPARATVTSVAGVGVEIVGLALFGAWALGGLTLVVVAWLPVAIALPWLLRTEGVSAVRR